MKDAVVARTPMIFLQKIHKLNKIMFDVGTHCCSCMDYNFCNLHISPQGGSVVLRLQDELLTLEIFIHGIYSIYHVPKVPVLTHLRSVAYITTQYLTNYALIILL